MSKVRRIDWSPDEWIAGTFGLLSGPETAVYIVVLNIIYSRDGECPNDARYLHTAFQPQVRANRHHRWPRWVTEDALAGLIAKGKLHVTPDGRYLTNGRADRELGKARERIIGAARAGHASGRSRSESATSAPRLRQRRANSENPVSSNANDLARTAVRIMQPPFKNTDLTTSTDAAREPAPDQTAPARAPAKPNPRVEALAAKARARFMKGET